MKQEIKGRSNVKQEINDRIKKIEQGIVPAGYKQTKVGIIPEDWGVRNFKDVFIVSQGLQIPISERFIENKTERYIYITNEYLNNIKLSRDSFIEYIENPKKSVICSEDDILMTRTGNTGKVITGVEGVFHNNFFKAKFDIKLNSKDFLVYLLNGNYIQHEIKKLAGTSTIPDLSHTDFYSIFTAIPEKNEQQKIADVLSTWDRAIELKETLIKEKEEQKKGLMEMLLWPNENESWEEVKVEELLIESKNIEKEPKVDRLLTVRLHLEGVQQRELRGNEKVGATTLYRRKKGQFIYGKQNFHNGSLGIIPEFLDGFASSSDIPSFDFKNGLVDSIYFYYYWSQINQYKRLINYTTGTGSKRLNPSDFFRIKMLLPCFLEQKHISNILSTADREIQLLKQSVEQLKEQKKGLMQLLLTGIIRVKGDDDE